MSVFALRKAINAETKEPVTLKLELPCDLIIGEKK